jgi:hypothetical protein
MYRVPQIKCKNLVLLTIWAFWIYQLRAFWIYQLRATINSLASFVADEIEGWNKQPVAPIKHLGWKIPGQSIVAHNRYMYIQQNDKHDHKPESWSELDIPSTLQKLF